MPRENCFVVSPFGGWNDRYYDDVYRPAVEKAGLRPCRADDLYRPSTIVNDIWSFVTSSKVMLADLTGKNPNVFYELGLAHASKKPVVLLTQAIEDVPFDLRALRVITYDVADPDWSLLLQEKITQALKEVIAAPQSAVLPTFLQNNQPPPPKSGTPQEKQILALQQQLNLLQSELSRPRQGMERIDPREARSLLAHYLRSGLPERLVVDRLIRYGVPRYWAEQEVRRAHKRKGR